MLSSPGFLFCHRTLRGLKQDVRLLYRPEDLTGCTSGDILVASGLLWPVGPDRTVHGVASRGGGGGGGGRPRPLTPPPCSGNTSCPVCAPLLEFVRICDTDASQEEETQRSAPPSFHPPPPLLLRSEKQRGVSVVPPSSPPAPVDRPKKKREKVPPHVDRTRKGQRGRGHDAELSALAPAKPRGSSAPG